MYTMTKNKEALKDDFYDATYDGRLEDVKRLSTFFQGDCNILAIALIMSCRDGHLNVVKWLIEHTAVDINYKIEWTPLTVACAFEKNDIVNYLLKTQSANLNLTDNDGRTPLTWTCIKFCLISSELLLHHSRDLDTNVADIYGNTSLHYAVWYIKPKDHNTELHRACVKGEIAAVFELVRNRDRLINWQNNDGNTPLHLACIYGHRKIVECLMFAGANETISNDWGETPAQQAKSRNQRQILGLLDRESLWKAIINRKVLLIRMSRIAFAMLLIKKLLLKRKLCKKLLLKRRLFNKLLLKRKLYNKLSLKRRLRTNYNYIITKSNTG